MLSSLITQHHQKTILFVDRIGFEEKHWKILAEHLLEDLGAKTIHKDFLEITNNLQDVRKNIDIGDLLKFPEDSVSIIFSSVASISRQYALEDFFRLIHKLQCSPCVKHIVLYATQKYIKEAFIVPFLEHLAEEIVTLEGKNSIKIVTRKPGGSVLKKNLRFSIENHRISTREEKKEEASKVPENPVNIDNLGTFKISLSEQDLLARNKLLLPFEKHLLNKTGDAEEKKSSGSEGKVIYYPEADDDIDEEDPDEDLEL
ncbi:uncharacterized protein LOC129791621 [Lutzomyia longipalpis]|uniref:uncharacterized protein LOC129791621 n=1 Tax=Lutzomyia longipalpis TaxID=7200 RepID=UPI0024835B36|nr:uncharacterized protein LOC129791621 [Lutzomyia longipalpis]